MLLQPVALAIAGPLVGSGKRCRPAVRTADDIEDYGAANRRSRPRPTTPAAGICSQQQRNTLQILSRKTGSPLPDLDTLTAEDAEHVIAAMKSAQ